MEKKYLLVAILLNILSFNSFAYSFKKTITTNVLELESTSQLNSPILLLDVNSSTSKTIAIASSISVCVGDNLTLNANPSEGSQPYSSYSWTGPNGFVSSDQNPVINNVTNTISGDYIVTYTDSASSVFQNTVTVTVTEKIDPTFDATVFAICKGGFSPILSPTSTNGISGTWYPSEVSNNATGTYVFTPDSGQCANTFSLIIYVINNVTPTFTISKSICYNSTPPDLQKISNNGIVGTWEPNIVDSTKSGSYTFTPTLGQCALPVTIQIEVQPLLAIFTPAIPPICSGDSLASLPTTSTNGVNGTWSPAINNTATTTYTFTPNSGQCTSTKVSMTIVVNPLEATFSQVAPICSGDALAALPNLSDNGVSGSWLPIIDNTATTTYTFTPTSGQCATTTTTMTIIVNPLEATFSQVNPICSGQTLADLPTTSTNGVTGNWSPAMNNTATTTYTFFPNSGQCATTPVTMTIVVNPIVVTFSQVDPICSGEALADLPTTSTNGVIGSWSPAMNNTATTTYTFTPTSGQCATTPVSMTIVVNPIEATFSQVDPICSGQTLADLPTTSTNGVTGNWSPAMNNTATTTYTFFPNSGQCATTPVTMTIVVNPIFATFSQVDPICSGEALADLPTTSTNGVIGSWSPAMNNTATTTYTFTPTSGQCATTPVSMTIVVNPIEATFSQVDPICSGQTLADLPTTSTNGVNGTWSPAMNNTATTTYTFTPDSGQCATTPVTMTIVVNPIIATFSQVDPICSGQTLANLPTTSTNSINGTWFPAMNNTATTTYTFTPTSGQCATTPVSMTIVVNPIEATFSQVDPICSGQTLADLPKTSTNGVTGTWAPAMNNTITTIYTFTPTSGQCATTPATMTIIVNPIIATFSQVDPICSGQTLADLPTTSTNSINGTWFPAMNNTATTTYTFTPNSGQCATTPVSMTIVVNPLEATFSQVDPICSGEALADLPTTSTNGVTGTWAPAMNNTITTTYTFTPTSGQCTTTPTTMTIIVNPIIATFSQVDPICSGETLADLPTTSTNSINGTWFPAMNNTATTTYTFTPNSGQCASTPVTMTIVVNPLEATFTQVNPICSGEALANLPTTSTNGVSGTWTPIMNNTITTTYTFTPTSGQCATQTTDMVIVVNQKTTPLFTPIEPICSGDTSPILPSISNNLIPGTWNPSEVSNTNTTTYTFTPANDQCATPLELVITVNPKVIPTFDAIPNICYGSTAPNLPFSSTNGIAGTWSPAIVSNTTSTTYTFTPEEGVCATTATVSIIVDTIVPTFNIETYMCINGTEPILPLISTNGITGKWNPSMVSNTVSGTYTFSPDADQCATNSTLIFTVKPILTPTFTAITPICSSATSPVLPLVSTNGVTGTWEPAVVSNLTSGIYTFTPAANECANSTTLNVTVVPNATPTFTQVAPICSGTTLAPLPKISINGFTGTWSPAINNTTTTTYTFSPTIGECALNTTMTIIVYQSPTALTIKTTDVINDKQEGIIEISNPINGVAPFQYSINNSSFDSDQIFTDLAPGDYTITIKDFNGCEYKTGAKINSICLFPNVITPNNDSYNNTFNLSGCEVERLQLFNRYGREVNYYTNYTNQWGGTNKKGETLPDGTYFYVAEIKGGTSKTGWIFITR